MPRIGSNGLPSGPNAIGSSPRPCSSREFTAPIANQDSFVAEQRKKQLQRRARRCFPSAPSARRQSRRFGEMPNSSRDRGQVAIQREPAQFGLMVDVLRRRNRERRARRASAAVRVPAPESMHASARNAATARKRVVDAAEASRRTLRETFDPAQRRRRRRVFQKSPALHRSRQLRRRSRHGVAASSAATAYAAMPRRRRCSPSPRWSWL